MAPLYSNANVVEIVVEPVKSSDASILAGTSHFEPALREMVLRSAMIESPRVTSFVRLTAFGLCCFYENKVHVRVIEI